MGRAQTIRNATLGRHALRLVQKDGHFYAMADGRVLLQGDDPETVWTKLKSEVGKTDPRYFGFDGARARFLHFFPQGFGPGGFDEVERGYKEGAAIRLRAALPLEQALEGGGGGPAALAAVQETNLLSPYEKIRLRALLRSPDADRFVQAAAGFARDGDRAALARLAAVARPHDCAKWTIATYLPFLWNPDRHMYLKPVVTQDFAVRVGHPLAALYAPRLGIEVYDALLDLVAQTGRALADLGPRDGIDIQSFIWVVGDYRDEVAATAS